MSAERIDQIEKRLKAAPWALKKTRCFESSMAYQQFVDAAPDDIAYLIARVRELEAKIGRDREV